MIEDVATSFIELDCVNLDVFFLQYVFQLQFAAYQSIEFLWKITTSKFQQIVVFWLTCPYYEVEVRRIQRII